MWNLKNLLISIVVGICAITCAYTFIVRDHFDFTAFSFCGLIVFSFVSFVFARNAKK